MYAISVKQLAEIVFRAGDLYEPGGRVTAEEGTQAHARLQKQRRRSGFESEVSVDETFNCEGLMLRVRGRADLVHNEQQLVEEIKTSRQPLLDPPAHHRAQAALYAAMLARGETSEESWTVRLTTVHPDTHEMLSREETLTAAELDEFLQDALHRYTSWLIDLEEHRHALSPWLAELRFPFAEPRPYQRAMMKRCAAALDVQEALLLEAPTGSGKTMSVLLPALRRTERVSRTWYLTSRSTGQEAAEKALAILDPEQCLRTSTITAKEKICPVPGQPCDPNLCRYARGYYDRRDDAVRDLLELQHMDRAAVEGIAERHEVCPFELSLDAARWSDVLIGDYNYLLDPVVRLERFAADEHAQLLIDESHHLFERVGEMLSVRLDRAVVRSATRKSSGAVERAARGLDRQLTKLRRDHPAAAAQVCLIDEPKGIARAAEKFCSAVRELQAGDPLASLADETLRCFFDCARWLRAEQWRDRGEFVFTLDCSNQHIECGIRCIDPSRYIRDTLDEFGSAVRFSATVSPPELHQAAHGFAEGGCFARAGTPFASDQLGVWTVLDVPTVYRARERSAHQLARLIERVAEARHGTYLVCFPSYSYLNLVFPLVRHDNRMQQEQDLDEAGRADFLETLRRDAPLAGVVLGGLFTESLDLKDTPLAGIIIVGVAIPPPDPVRDAMAQHYHHLQGSGETFAYIQPGMTKIVQAAGRLIRDRDHRGALVLVDHRYQQPQYQQFFPSHWQPRVTTADELPHELTTFWSQP